MTALSARCRLLADLICVDVACADHVWRCPTDGGSTFHYHARPGVRRAMCRHRHATVTDALACPSVAA